MSETTTETLTAPLVLDPPAPVPTVQEQESNELVKLDDRQLPALEEKIGQFIDDVLHHEAYSDAFKDRVRAVHQLGSQEIRAAAAVSNRMMDRPANAMNQGLFDHSPIAKSLVDLRNTIEDLDPSKQDLFAPRKLFGLIPWGNRLRDYFLGYQSSQNHINHIIESLYHGKDELLKDNAAIEQEKVNLWHLMHMLRQYIYVGEQIDARLSAKIAEIEQSDSEKARIVKEEMLFYVRQKHIDLLTQLTVSIQGYLTLDMVRKNNLELIKGVDRATTTTISALRTAVMAAQALTNQKLVLDQITALNKTTSALIESTSEMLKQQTGEIHQQAASSTLEIDKLKTAFANIYATMDSIAEFKVKALDNMQQTVNTLSAEVEKSQAYLRRARGEGVDEVAESIQVNPEEIATSGEIKL